VLVSLTPFTGHAVPLTGGILAAMVAVKRAIDQAPSSAVGP
jgi:hypothetical protein